MWDYALPRAPLIPLKLLIEECRVLSLRSSKKGPTSYLHDKSNPTYYDAYDRGFIIEDKIDETLEDENLEADVQIIEHRQLPDIQSNDVNNSKKCKLGTISHMQMKYTMRECSF